MTEIGNKNKKKSIIIAIVIFVILGLSAGIIIWRTQDKSRYFEMTNEDFFNHALNYTNPGDVKIHSVDGYYKDGYCYYQMFSSEISLENGELLNFELVYFGKPGDISGMFNPNWDDMYHLKADYEAYLEAKEDGYHYTMTEEQIQKGIEDYYQSK